ncbi:hypothetical protein GCM10010519_69830 [Streptomyces lactacystinicus]|uniref:hypothetical protein n=1 Tax=unclassified Kitasatospora TaxID=2633591 RepID=UPI00336D47ED
MSTPDRTGIPPARARLVAELQHQRLLAGLPSLSSIARGSDLSVSAVSSMLTGRLLPSEQALKALLDGMGVSSRDQQHALLLRDAASAARTFARRAPAEPPAAEPPVTEPPADERPAPDWRVPVPAAGEPDPVLFSTVREFVAGLEDVRVWAGEPSLRRLEERSERLHRQRHTAYGKVLRRSTISDMLNASVLPQMEKVRHYLQICGVRDIDAWVYTWRRIRTIEKAAVRRAA